MRTPIVAGNWKMNADLSRTKTLIGDLKDGLKETAPKVRIIVAPTFPNLYPANKALKESPIELAAQNMHQAENGAYTGEVSAGMLKSVGVSSVILGHSERRAHFKESAELLAQKVSTALAHELDVLFCVGEQLEDRQSGHHFETVKRQLAESLFQFDQHAWNSLVIAYEPVWAIGTGETATAEQAQEMHAFIRKTLAEKYGPDTAENVSILYGGSVKPHNAGDIFSQPDVDGGLIGGASLKAADFLAIVNAI